MLGEVMDGSADFCIADISITAARASAFTFSMPWLNLGISILYVMPTAAPPSLLAFLDPFSTEVNHPISENPVPNSDTEDWFFAMKLYA